MEFISLTNLADIVVTTTILEYDLNLVVDGY